MKEVEGGGGRGTSNTLSYNSSGMGCSAGEQQGGWGEGGRRGQGQMGGGRWGEGKLWMEGGGQPANTGSHNLCDTSGRGSSTGEQNKV